MTAAPTNTTERRDLLRFITAGSVDDGKSTLIGRLLYESRGIYVDQLAAVQRASDRRGTGMLDLSLVTDGLRAEREQGITIDVARRYFSTPRRKFIIADTPGHEQYTRNMATGASTAELAVILLDASRGVTAQSHRHAFIAVLMGIAHLVVVVNKMDLVGYAQSKFEQIRDQFAAFAAKLQAADLTFIPISSLAGDNIVTHSEKMPWYQGTTLLNHLETVHIASDRNFIDLRLPVQYVSRAAPDAAGGRGMFRGYMGTVASGVIRPGDEVMVLPSGRRTRVEKVLGPDGEIPEGFPPLGVCVTLADERDVSRGDMLVHVHNLPRVGENFEAMLLWMGSEPLEPGGNYLIKHTTRTVPGTVAQVRYRVDVTSLHRRTGEGLALNEIGRVAVRLGAPICYDAYTKNRTTGAFIIIDRVTNNTVGAGMILDRESHELHQAIARWSGAPSPLPTGLVHPAERAERLGQKPVTVWLTGAGAASVATGLDKRLFDAGRTVFVLTEAQLGDDLPGVAALFNQAGLIVLCVAQTPPAAARATIGAERFLEAPAPAESDAQAHIDAILAMLTAGGFVG